MRDLLDQLAEVDERMEVVTFGLGALEEKFWSNGNFVGLQLGDRVVYGLSLLEADAARRAILEEHTAFEVDTLDRLARVSGYRLLQRWRERRRRCQRQRSRACRPRPS